MDRKQIFLYLDRAIIVFLCLVVFCLPFSKAGVESFLWPAVFLWILKRVLGYRDESLSRLLPKTGLNKALGVFVAVVFLSVIFSTDFGLSLRGFFGKELKFLVLFFMLVEVINTRARLRNVLIVIASAAVLIAVDAAVQYLFGKDFIRGYGWARSRASFSTSNGFAAWLIIMIPLFFGLLAGGKGLRKWFKVLLSGFIIFLLFCLLATYVRGAWFGLAISVCFILWYFFKNFKLKVKLLSLFIFLGLLGIFLVLPYSMKSRIASMGRLNFRSYVTINERIKSFVKIKEGDSTPVRLKLWAEALNITRDFPLFGCGLNTYSIVARGYKSFEQGGIYPHNSYLHRSAETGLIGLAAFFLILLSFFKVGLGYLNEKKDIFVLCLLSGILAFLIHAFFDDLFYSLQLAVLFWYILGLTIAIIKLETGPIKIQEDK